MSTENIIDDILKSYDKYDTIQSIDSKKSLNKKVLIQITETLRNILFPGFFTENQNNREYIKYILGEQLEFVQYHLKKQTVNALCSCDSYKSCEEEVLMEKAAELVNQFMSKLTKIRDYLYTDVEAAYNGDPAAYSRKEIIFSYPGLFTISIYRIAHELFLLKIPMIPRIMTEYAHGLTGIDIHPGATIGKYFFIDHGTGIVIGETTVIGDNVKIYQGVTLGALSTRKGQLLKGVKRHPTLKDNVTVYSGTSILGGDTVIGKDATIGGNAFITSSVPDGTKVSVKNPELQFVNSKSVELNQGEFWDWII